MASYHPVKFSSHWHCGSGDMLLVAKQKESRCSRLNPLLFFSKEHGLKAHGILY